MGTGATIKTGGGSGKKPIGSKSSAGGYYNRNQDPYLYGIVKSYDEKTKIVIYTPLEDRISTGGEKLGTAYPFYPNMAKLLKEGDIIPLLRGPAVQMDINIANQYDKSTYYLNPIDFQQTVNANQIDTNSNTNVETNSYKSTTLGTSAKIASSEIIKNEYIPSLEKIFPQFPKGIKLLMAAQAQLEGFYPGSKSYRNNNPGNVGTYGGIHVTSFPTLEKGIEAQWHKVLKGALRVEGARSAYYKPTDTLYKYLSTYAPSKDNNNPLIYTNFIIGYFNKNGITITANTTLEQIQKLS